MPNGTLLFLDIEGTIIDDFDGLLFMDSQINAIKSLISNADELFCFSWAICNTNDLTNKLPIIRAIEKRICRPFDSFIFRDGMLPLFRKKFGNIDMMEFEEICRSLGKEIIFRIFISDDFKSDKTDFLLVDDTVTNTSLYLVNRTIRTLNICDLNGVKND